MIKFQDNTVRDGMQQRNLRKDLKTQLKIFDLLKTTNIHSLEVGMCTTKEDFQLISEKSTHLGELQKMVVLTRLIPKDIELTCKLVNVNKNLVVKLLVPISTLHILKKLNSTKENMLAKLQQSLNYISNLNIKVDVCLEDATRADETYLFKVLELCNNYNIDYVTIADTVGCSTPEEYGALIKKIYDCNYSFGISIHCHNDMGLATANTIAGILNGATQVETTFLGIGERAGNSAVDEILCILNKKYNIKTDLDLKNIYEISKLIEDVIGYTSSPLKPIIGKNAFIHESGIHQDGMLKDKSMYQYIAPEDFGKTTNIYDSPISGISSSKIIATHLKSKFRDLTNTEIVNIEIFYRNISKIINDVTIEDAYHLFNIIFLEDVKNGSDYRYKDKF
ncbi:LeuA family protein [Clostridium pasteurianum]|uniref:2-isopropylmalate synthase n=1 Tax=Clostridium pasteurianum BC1 TaxID=86416 RepID=R4KAJ7_CLOPA|nr:LeuA family protein [Clostridium pasteurianum]AGK96665.1 isopropylmalate/homocitrate/citramalate synthase [Clostridium pasteurianum BC1]